MHKKLTLILILILVLAQLCACGKPQAEPSPAAESEAAAPAELPEEEAPDEPDEPAGRTPDRVLTSTKYTAEVYIETTQYGQYQIESREYAVSDGVSATGLRAAGRGSYIRFFDQTVTEAGTVWYYDKSAGDWRSQALGDGLDLPELKQMISLLRYTSNNINQIAKRLNESGRAYDTDLAEILEKQKQLWGLANKILMKLSTIQ